MAKSKSKCVTFKNASPMRKQRASLTSATSTANYGLRRSHEFLPVVAMGFKNYGVRRIIGQYAELESEVMSLKQHYYESRLKVRTLKQMLKEQRTKSRQLIVSCTLKLQEKEDQIEEMKQHRDDELSHLARQLLYLQSNLLKEKKRLKKELSAKDAALEASRREADLLREMLSEQIRSQQAGSEDKREDKQEEEGDDNATTASSDDDDDDDDDDDEGPFNNVPRFEIKPRNVSLSPSSSSLSSHDASPLLELPPPLPLPLPPPAQTRRRRKQPPFLGHSADEAFCLTPMVPRVVASDNPVAAEAKEKEIEKEASKEVVSDEKEAKENDNWASFAEFKDSGRESDSSEQSDKLTKFTDFLANHGLDQKSIISPSVTLTNHRTFQRPSDVKNRGRRANKIRSTVSDLSVLEEHEVIGSGRLTTVTYWGGQYL